MDNLAAIFRAVRERLQVSLQARSVDLFTSLHAEARPGFEDFTKSVLDYARKHRDAIHQFGRFPHRNAVVGRVSTPDELEWLAEGGGF